MFVSGYLGELSMSGTMSPESWLFLYGQSGTPKKLNCFYRNDEVFPECSCVSKAVNTIPVCPAGFSEDNLVWGRLI